MQRREQYFAVRRVVSFSDPQTTQVIFTVFSSLGGREAHQCITARIPRNRLRWQECAGQATKRCRTDPFRARNHLLLVFRRQLRATAKRTQERRDGGQSVGQCTTNIASRTVGNCLGSVTSGKCKIQNAQRLNATERGWVLERLAEVVGGVRDLFQRATERPATLLETAEAGCADIAVARVGD